MSVIIENVTEDNVTEFIIRYLGKPRINNETLYPLTFIYTSFLLLGLLGNLATCIVILNNEYMKSPTNVYLINLAVADIATLLLGKKLYIHIIVNFLILQTCRISQNSRQAVEKFFKKIYCRGILNKVERFYSYDKLNQYYGKLNFS